MITFLYFIFISQISLSISDCIPFFNHCSKCNPITNLCFKCEKDIYSPDDKGGCGIAKKCEINNNHCLECQPEGDLCKTCEPSYFPDENGQCSYTKNCEISEQGKCLKCKDNFILIGQNSDFSIKVCKLISSEDLKNCEKIK